MSENRRVLVVGNLARSLVTFRGHMMSEFVRAGFAVTGCAPEIDDSVRSALSEMGVEARRIPLRREGGSFVSDLATLADLTQWITRHRPAITITYTAKPIVLGNHAARLCHVPRRVSIVAGLGSMFGADATETRGMRILRRLYASGLGAATHVILQNRDDRAFLENEGLVGGSQRVTVVDGSGVDLSEFAYVEAPGHPIVFSAMRLIEEKGIRELATAAKRVRERIPGARFVVAGWFDPANPRAITPEEMQEWVDEGTLEFVGRLDDVRPALEEASVFVLPSYYREGVPRISLEALAVGRPIVTCDSPGCRETVVHDRNGLLVAPRDADGLARALTDLLSDPERIRRMGRESRRLAEERFDVNIVDRAILEHILDASELERWRRG